MYFYKMVQNKLHFAVTGKTAAEIIHSRADNTKDNMGLTTWKNAPQGKILKSDIGIAKNYLHENELAHDYYLFYQIQKPLLQKMACETP